MDVNYYCGWSKLMIASLNGRLDEVKTLIEAGANVNQTNKDNTTPLYMASEEGHHDIVQTLLRAGADVNTAKSYDAGKSPLMIALLYGHLDVVKTLIEAGANVNHSDKDYTTPLYMASEKGHHDIVQTLLGAGADVNKPGSYYKESPLYVASRNNHHDVVQTLLEAGADVNVSYNGRSHPLMIALLNGRLDIVKTLIEAGASVNQSDKDNRTPLYMASEKGHYDVVQSLLGAGADVNIARSDDGRSPLMIALLNGHLDIVKTLIEAGANVNQTDKDNTTPLYMASQKGHHAVVQILLGAGADVNIARSKYKGSPLYVASEKGHHDVVLTLLGAGADVNIATSYDGRTPLMIAFEKGHLDIMKTLIEGGANVNQTDMDNKTPLCMACEKGHHDAVLTLLGAGADVNIATSDNFRSPLMTASYNGHLDVVKTLIEAGANVSQTDMCNTTPLYMASQKGHHDVVQTLLGAGADVNKATSDNGRSPLMTSSYNGHLDVVKTLIEAGVNVNQTDTENTTPLYMASGKGHHDAVLTLLGAGADVNIARSDDGKNPLMKALLNGHLDVVKTLIQAGTNVNQSDKDNRTPLYVASVKGHHDVVQTLLGAGADVNIATSDGWSPLMIASDNGDLDVVKTLIKARANVNQTNKDGNTPLHHAANGGHTTCVRHLLSTPGVAVNTKNIKQQTPLMVATKYDVIKSIQKYSTCYQDYPVHTFNKVILCGDTGAGKSTLAKTIIESAKSAGRIGYFKNKLNLDEVAKPLTAGIVAYKVHNSKSNMMLYDFAGHHTYYSSHSSLLEAISLTSPSTFLMLVDVTVGLKGIAAQMYYWSAMICNVCHECPQPSSVIVVGTHADKVKKGSLTDLEAEIKKLARDMFKKHIFVQFVALNVTTNSIDLMNFLCLLDGVSENVLQRSPAISLSSHLMYAFLNDKVPSDKEAISLRGLLSLLEKDKPRVLPTETSEIIALLTTLAHKGFIVFLQADGQDSWIVRDLKTLLEKVNGALFAPSFFKEHLPIASNTGIIPLNVLKSHFPNHNTAMIVQFLIQLQLCQHINLINVNTNMAPTIPSSSDMLFFPSLTRESRPHFDSSDITTLGGCFGWLLYAHNIHQFFPNRFLHTLLLNLAYNICLPDTNHEINADIQSNNRQCKVWSTGISWRSVKGVSTTIELMEYSRCLFLVMAFPHQKFCNELAHVLQTIKTALSHFCPSVAATEYIVDPSTASSVFLQGCSPLSLTRVQLSHLKGALKDDDPVVVDTNGEVVVIKNWTSVGLDLPRLVSIAVNGDGIVQEKQAPTINPLNGCTPVVPSSPSQPLSQLVAQGISQLEGTPTMQELLCFSDQKVNIAVLVGAKYCTFGIFILDDKNGTIVEALEIEHLKNAERINMAILQKWLQGKGVKPVTWSTLVTALERIN